MGIISSKTHTIIGAIVGVLLIAAPFVLGFSDNDSAKWVAILVGVFILANELITTSPLSPIKLVPMSVHIALDVITGIFLAVSPWLFGFADEDTNVWLPHVIVGILVVGYALVTKTADSLED